MLQTITIDAKGQLTLPKQALEALGLPDATEVELLIEMTEAGIVIRPKPATPLTDSISAMDLPIADWETLEAEMEVGQSGNS